MATIAHEGHIVPVEKRAILGRVVLGILGVWAALGVLVGVTYANHVIIGDWNGAAAHFANPIRIFVYGALIWLLGFVVLGIVSWETRNRN